MRAQRARVGAVAECDGDVAGSLRVGLGRNGGVGGIKPVEAGVADGDGDTARSRRDSLGVVAQPDRGAADGARAALADAVAVE